MAQAATDLYGLDRKLATTLFGDPTGFPLPTQGTKRPREEEAIASPPVKQTSSVYMNPAYGGEIVALRGMATSFEEAAPHRENGSTPMG